MLSVSEYINEDEMWLTNSVFLSMILKRSRLVYQKWGLMCPANHQCGNRVAAGTFWEWMKDQLPVCKS